MVAQKKIPGQIWGLVDASMSALAESHRDFDIHLNSESSLYHLRGVAVFILSRVRQLKRELALRIYKLTSTLFHPRSLNLMPEKGSWLIIKMCMKYES